MVEAEINMELPPNGGGHGGGLPIHQEDDEGWPGLLVGSIFRISGIAADTSGVAVAPEVPTSLAFEEY